MEAHRDIEVLIRHLAAEGAAPASRKPDPGLTPVKEIDAN
jgi:hypothetical protein